MHPAAALNIPLALLIVFGSAKLLGEVCARLGQPAIVGEILAGILIGPGVLGWIAPNQVLTALAELGVMFLLFRVGMEVKTSELLRVGGTAVVVATVGVIVPFFLGWGIMALWRAPHVECMFVGAAMVATSVGITAHVLAEKGVLWHRASQVILSAAVIDDVLGLLVLAIVSSTSKGKLNLPELLLTAAIAIGFTLLVATVGRRAVGHVLPRVTEKLQAGEGQFHLALFLLFGLSLLATWAGIAAIIGAFLAGMAVSESVGQRVHDLTQGVTEFLVPFFLAGVGLQFNVAAFTQRSVLILAAVILVAAVISKVIGCGLGALRFGWGDAARIGVGMVPRGEVGMVVAQIGLHLGVIPPAVYAIVVFMSIATTIVAPPLLNTTFRNVRRLPSVEEYQPG